MKEKFVVKKEFITLGQFLKEIDEIPSGGMAKWYLQEHTVIVDGELENRRGRKLYPGSMVELPERGIFFMERIGVLPKSVEENINETN